MILSREPRAILRPFVRTLWAVDPKNSPPPEAAERERVLPTGSMHVVFRVADDPLRLYNHAEDLEGNTIGHSLVGGARSMPYVRDISRPAASVGAQLLPGASEVLFGVPATELAGCHTPLDNLWGGAAEETRERLSTCASPEEQLALFETLLAARLPRVRGLHPAVAYALERFTDTDDVREVVRQTGYSHRRFIQLFIQAVGLTPKLYCRVNRFQRVLDRIVSRPDEHWADRALDAGYSDQSHFNRQFREFSGLTPTEYDSAAPVYPNHVPIRPSS